MTDVSALPSLSDRNISFHGISFNTGTRSTKQFTIDDLGKELKNPDVFSWIDVESGNIDDLNVILQALRIDIQLMSHFDEPEVLPRIVEGSDCLAFYLYETFNPEKHLDTSHGLNEIEISRIILVLGADYIITFHRRKLEVVEYVKSTCIESFQLAGKTPGFVAFLFMQQCLYDYAHLNLANDNYLDSLEAEVFTGTPKALAAKISVAGLNILTLKKMTASLHIVLMLIVTKKSRFISDEARGSFGQMLNNVIAIRSSIDSSRDLLDGIINSFQAAAANRTSEIARVLTVVSAIILPLSLIAGIYGMNFQFMPELNYRIGYFVVLGGMLLIGLILLGLFWRLGWIGSGQKTSAD